MKKSYIIFILILASTFFAYNYFSKSRMQTSPPSPRLGEIKNLEPGFNSNGSWQTDIQEAGQENESQSFKEKTASALGSMLSKFSKKAEITYPIVDTGITESYGSLKGQDSDYSGNQPSYSDNKNGTITDNVTGLTWQQDMGSKMSFNQAQEKIKTFELAGYSDWRIPTIKELYSLILFTGQVGAETAITPFIDTNYFIQPLGDTSKGEREIDAQTWSSTQYTGLTMNKDETVFGVNFIDGRIKGYPKYDPRSRADQKMYFRFVRGNEDYGKNNFVDNGDGTVSDLATGLMWQQSDSKKGLDWQEAINYSENLELAGYDDWRLPNAKELQSIVDYSRSPQVTNSAAIDPVFEISKITDPNGKANYPFFWSSTTHLDGKNQGSQAVYVCFGECQGKMNGKVVDVHGAGAQRSDPKTGNINDYPQYFGPQGDIRYVYNYVRAVRDIK